MITTITCCLEAGDSFDDLAGPGGHGWRLSAGALRLDPVEEPGREGDRHPPPSGSGDRSIATTSADALAGARGGPVRR